MQNVVADKSFARAKFVADDKRIACQHVFQRVHGGLSGRVWSPYHMALSGGVAHDERLALRVNKEDWSGVVWPRTSGAVFSRRDRHGFRVHKRFDESRIAVTQADISNLMVEKRIDAALNGIASHNGAPWLSRSRMARGNCNSRPCASLEACLKGNVTGAAAGSRHLDRDDAVISLRAVSFDSPKSESGGESANCRAHRSAI